MLTAQEYRLLVNDNCHANTSAVGAGDDILLPSSASEEDNSDADLIYDSMEDFGASEVDADDDDDDDDDRGDIEGDGSGVQGR